MRRLKIELGIRNKVLFGFVVIGVMLFLSGIIAFFEFGRMSKYVSTLINDNIASVNTSRLLMNVSDKYNTNLLEMLGDDSLSEIPHFEPDTVFINNLTNLQNKSSIEKERAMADSVMYAYVAYMHVVYEVEEVWIGGYSARRDWYFDRLQSVYDKLRGYIQELTRISQNALADNYYNLKDSFYRSMMPGIVAVAAGIVLVILFNYFLNVFILNPLIKMNKGVKNYRDFNKTYDVKFDSGGDQIEELNRNIKEIIDENKALKKR